MNNLIQEIKATISSNQKFVTVFYGDSTTSAEWVHPNWRAIIEYVVKMELEDFEPTPKGTGQWNYSWWNLNFINAGLNGATTEDFLERLDKDVFSYNPNMIISITGDNDVGKISLKKHASNHKKIIDQLKNKIKNIYYATSTYTGNQKHNEQYSLYVDELKKIFPIDGVNFINLFEEFKSLPVEKFYTYEITLPEEQFLTDEKGGNIDLYHPNVLGNAYIAKILLKHIFNIDFNPEKYVASLSDAIKYPRY